MECSIPDSILPCTASLPAQGGQTGAALYLYGYDPFLLRMGAVKLAWLSQVN